MPLQQFRSLLPVVLVLSILTAGCATTKKSVPVRPEESPSRVQQKTPTYDASARIWALDSFEQLPSTWSVDTWANPAVLTSVNGTLQIEMKAGKYDKSSLSRPLTLDLTSRKKISLDVQNNAGQVIRLAVATATGQVPTYFESESVHIKKGRNRNVTFDLAAATFKTPASQWLHTSKIANPSQVKRIFILVYGPGSGTVTIDNLNASSE